MLVSVMGMAQGTFVVNGRLKIDGGSLDGSRMVVYMDGVKHRTLNTDLNRFSLEMELNKSYVLSFEKDGFVTKKLSFNTNVPAIAAQIGFTPFSFVVSLFKQYDGLNTVVFNQPVGMIRYDAALADFDYDTDYTKSIQSALDAAQAEVEKKQKDEVRENADSRKRKEQEAKEAARAAARAAKDSRQKADPVPVPKAQPPATEPVQATAPLAPPPPPVRKERPPSAAVSARMAVVQEGTDKRRTSEPRMMAEPSRVQAAVPREGMEPRPKFDPAPMSVVRQQDVIVQPNEVVTIIKLQQGDLHTEYRRVSRKFSGVYYFKNGISCSKLVYESEALAGN